MRTGMGCAYDDARITRSALQPLSMVVADRRLAGLGEISYLGAAGDVSYFRAVVIDHRGRPMKGIKVDIRGGDVQASGETDGDGFVSVEIPKNVGTRILAFINLPEFKGELPPSYELPTVGFEGKTEIFRSTESVEPFIMLSEAIAYGIAIAASIVGLSLHSNDEDAGILALGVGSSVFAGTTLSVISRHTR